MRMFDQRLPNVVVMLAQCHVTTLIQRFFAHRPNFGQMVYENIKNKYCQHIKHMYHF
jgi:hypothetical protein